MRYGFLLLATLVSDGSVQTHANNRPHVLFVSIDDLRLELGCYGAEYMKTPNIDRVAARGIVFKKAYCQQAICAPSRVSLMTGLRPDTTGIYDLDHPLDDFLPQARTIPQHFQQHGYKTISLGKIYHHKNDDHEHWDVLDACPAPHYAEPDTVSLIRRLTREAREASLRGKERRNYTRGPAYERMETPDNTYSGGIVAERALNAIKNRDDRPLFLAVGFRKPHLPFVAPKRYWDLYDPEKISIPAAKTPGGAPHFAFSDWGELRSYRGMPSTGFLTQEQARMLIHGYRACTSYTDAQLGRILDELEREDLLDHTLVVVWGDHGWKLGEYGDWCKHTNFELDTHVPLIYSGPSVPHGASSDALVELIDIFPTLAECCGLPAPACEGVSSTPLFEDPERPWKSTAFSQYPRSRGVMGYSIRSGPWRYTEWRRRHRGGKLLARELYDHSSTEVAAENLVDDPQYASVVEAMAAVVAKGPATSRSTKEH